MAGFGRRSTAEQVSEGVDLSGRNALVTGANTGLGKETARVLALRGANVTLACRDMEKAEVARREILGGASGAIVEAQLELLTLDLNNLAAVRRSAEQFLASGKPLHLLVNNAGIMIPMERRTDDGFEAHFGINHLAHYLFTRLLLPALCAAEEARVVMVSSAAMVAASLTESFDDLNWKERKFSGMRSYGDSKLMNLMFAKELTRRYADAGVVANALHPGIIATELARDQSRVGMALGVVALPFMKNIPQGAATSLYVATAPECGRDGGEYFVNCQRRTRPDHKLANSQQACEVLWETSEILTGLAEAG